ncbi:MAG TPA: AraC family transcriptional regulator [Saprospiraceae bacterium]|nr:AraC family transcriptional regulator [Saprospiraceae bacterium]
MSKPVSFKVPPSSSTAFRFQEDFDALFYNRFHSHPEVQFSYIVSSHGIASIGYRAVSFQPDDLFVLGAKVPHVFRNDQPGPAAHALSILFLPETFGQPFYDLPEAGIFNKLWKEAERGIKITGFEYKSLMEDFRQAKGLARLILFLELAEIVHYHPRKSLILAVLPGPANPGDQERMQAVYQYIAENYERPIRLEEVADVAAMSPTAFCRYFKSRTRYSLVQYLNTYRIEVASKRLVERDLPVAQIAESCGFRNLANFNRQFRAITGKTPQGYRKSVRSVPDTK